MSFVKLFVRTAGEDPSSQVSIDCPKEETVALLKQLVQLSHRAQPAPLQQKLIYAGAVLREEQRIRDVFPLHIQEGPFTVHLVISTADQVRSQSSSENTHPTPLQPQGHNSGMHGYGPGVNHGHSHMLDPATAEAYQHYVNYMLYWSSLGVNLGYTFPQFVETILPTLRTQMQNAVPDRPLAPEQHQHQQPQAGFHQNLGDENNPAVGQGQQAAAQPRIDARPNINFGEGFNIVMRFFVAYMLLSNNRNSNKWIIIGLIALVWFLFKYGYIQTTYQSRRYYHIRQQTAERAAAERAANGDADANQDGQQQQQPLPEVRLSLAQEVECLLLPLFFSLLPSWEELQEQPRPDPQRAEQPNPNQ